MGRLGSAQQCALVPFFSCGRSVYIDRRMVVVVVGRKMSYTPADNPSYGSGGIEFKHRQKQWIHYTTQSKPYSLGKKSLNQQRHNVVDTCIAGWLYIIISRVH